MILDLDLDKMFDITMKSSNAKKIFPTPTSVRTFLKKFCDIHGITKKKNILFFNFIL